MPHSIAGITTALATVLGAVSGITGGAGVVNTRERTPNGIADATFQAAYAVSGSYNGWEVTWTGDESAIHNAYPLAWERVSVFRIRGWYQWADTSGNETAWQTLLAAIDAALGNSATLRDECTEHGAPFFVRNVLQVTEDREPVRHVEITQAFRWTRQP